ncbi:MAG: hypothetical protein RL172_3352 [Bacteroidota bacterium]|jgi:2-polyprenyl-3-methyl-5-hydroxy-6-metoxy-1,4-benzoquinol methylase
MTLYKEKKISYYTSVRTDLVKLLPAGKPLKVLEIGAGGGDTLVKIKQDGIAAEVVGVELFDLPGSNQQHPAIDKMIIADIEHSDIDLPVGYFDAVICGDVLEHLYNPWEVVSKLSGYLVKGGLLIVSVPNFSHFSVFWQLFVKRSFAYSSKGTFDKTHVRFFCKNDMRQLVENSQLQQSRIYANINLVPCRARLLNRLTLGVFESYITPQYVAVSVKTA